jgi:catalase
VKISGADPTTTAATCGSDRGGRFPEYELGLQVFTEEQADEFSFDVLDATKIVPEELVPVTPVGRHGARPQPRQLLRRDRAGGLLHGAHRAGHRLHQRPAARRAHPLLRRHAALALGGPNFHEIPINAPVAQVHNNQRDGMHRQAIHRGRVAYEPNSLGGGCPFQAGAAGFVSFPEPDPRDKVRGKPEKFADHYTQATLFWNSQTRSRRRTSSAASASSSRRCRCPAIRERMVSMLRNVSDELAEAVADGLGIELPEPLPLAMDPPQPEVTESPALSLLARPGDGSIAGRKVAILVAPGVDGAA